MPILEKLLTAGKKDIVLIADRISQIRAQASMASSDYDK